MAKTSTWMPLYIGEYLADTMRLSTVQHGAYLLLLMEYWRTGPLPDSDAELAAITRMDAAAWKKIAPSIRRFFAVHDDGLLHQKRADGERAKAAELSEKRRLAGSQKGSNGPANPPTGGSKTPANGELLQEQLHKQMQSNSTSNSTSNSIHTRGSRAIVPPLPQQEEAKQPLPFPDSRAAGPQRDASARLITPRNPAANDPPEAWLHLCDRQPDGSPKLENEPGTPRHGKPLAGGYYLDTSAQMVAEAAGWPCDWRGDWTYLAEWLRAGADLHDHIVPTVSRLATGLRAKDGSVAGTLRYFDSAVREAAGRMRA